MSTRSTYDSHDVTLSLVAAGVCVAMVVAMGRLHRVRPNVSVGPSEARISVVPKAYEEGLPAVGRNVLFHNGRGDLMDQKRTQADGSAPGEITADGSVTILMGGTAYSMVTYYGLQKGDAPAGGESEKEQEHGELGTVRVALPKMPPGANAIGASLGRGITSPPKGQSVELQLVPDFVANDRFSVLALAMEKEEPKAYGYIERSAKETTGTVTFETWRTDWHDVPFRIGGLEGIRGELKAEWRAKTAEAAHFEMGDTHHTLTGQGSVAGSFHIPRAMHADTEWDIEVESETGTVGEMGESKGTERIDIPFGERAMPSITLLTIEPSNDPQRPIVSFEFDRVPKADFVQLRLVWGANDSHVWDIVMPPAQRGTIRVPAIPEKFAAWAPAGNVKVGAGAFDVSYIASYSALVARGIEEIEESDVADKSVRYSVRGILAAP